MRGAAFWKADWFPGLAASCAMFAILAGGRVVRPVSANAIAWLASALIAAYLIALLPRLTAMTGVLATSFLLIVLAASSLGLRQFALVVPLASVLAGHLLLAGLRRLPPARAANRQPVQTPSVEPSAGSPSPTRAATGIPAVAQPAMIGRYRIERELGHGAMGAVFLGLDAETGTRAAIKTLALAQAFAPDELADVRARFFREAETAGRLRHPDIVAVLEAGEAGDLAYIAMEYLAGGDLRSFSRPDHLLPWPEVAAIGARIADALAYAHAHNVVHRDVKPANVMYDPAHGQLRVMDFGVARIVDSSHTKTGMVLGTPSYMSPEQLLGKRVDGRTDLYSLGVLLYQLACGQLPFVGQSLGQLMSRIANETCPSVRAVNPKIPEALATVIERAMRKAAAERFQSGEEMAKALRACLAADGGSGIERLAEAGGDR
ncbi:MAG: serine/threonine-protein kinase [Propionivibrio sp.]